MQRDQRLKRAADFQAIRERGKSWADRRLVVAARWREPEDHAITPASRFGFSVSKRIGNAVVRNRTKRRLRALVQGADVARGWDVLVIARKGLVGADYSDMERSMVGLLRRAGIGPSIGQGSGDSNGS